MNGIYEVRNRWNEIYGKWKRKNFQENFAETPIRPLSDWEANSGSYGGEHSRLLGQAAAYILINYDFF